MSKTGFQPALNGFAASLQKGFCLTLSNMLLQREHTHTSRIACLPGFAGGRKNATAFQDGKFACAGKIGKHDVQRQPKFAKI